MEPQIKFKIFKSQNLLISFEIDFENKIFDNFIRN